MTRQTGIRSRDSILAELARGPITDPSGRATAKLLELTGYQGTLTGISNLLKTMEREGLVTRRVSGKRCFEIRSLAPSAASQRSVTLEPTSLPVPALEPEPDAGVDVTRLAAALLDRAIELAGKPERDASTLETAQTRLAELLEENERLRRQLRLAQDEAIARKHEVDGLRQRLSELRRNLDKMTNGHRIDERWLRELRDLAKLMVAPPNGKG